MSTSVFKASGPSTSGKGPRVKYVRPFGTSDPPKRPSMGSVGTRNTIRYQGKHNATCSACRDYGELTDCDTCRRAWHTRCVRGGGDPPLNNMDRPPEFWRCPICIGKTENIPALGTPVSTPRLNAPIHIDTPGRDPTVSSLPSSTPAQPTQILSQRRLSDSPPDYASKRRKIDPPATRPESESERGEPRTLKHFLESAPGSGLRESDFLGEEDGQPEFRSTATDERNVALSANPIVIVIPDQVDGKAAAKAAAKAGDRAGDRPAPTGFAAIGLGGPTNTNANGILSPPLNPAPITSATTTTITSPSQPQPPSTAPQTLDTPTPSPHPTSTPTNLITGLQLYLNQVCDKLVESEGTMQALERELEASKAKVRKMQEEKERVEGENEFLRKKLDGIRRAIEG
ncbi:MAG: hypothetical protein M1840_003260 [Geoglossum simile]|nr:MAG: hypothetical protein M1840_003260 [Geoglossum simile]